MLKWLKRLKYIIPVVVVLILIVGAFIVLGVVCRDEDIPFAKEGWKAAQKKTTSGAPATWMPWHKPTKADKVLKDWPAGTKIIEIEPRTEPLIIAIPPSGEVLIPKGETGVTVYEKPKRSWGPEFRPFIGGAYAEGPAVLAGADLFTLKIVKQVHIGPAIAYNGEFSGGGSIAVNIWRNLDGRGYVGADFSGGVIYGGGLTIGIQ